MALDNPHWVIGNGTGTASLGTQYVDRLVGERPLYGVEEGFGTMILEMGILAPFLWICSGRPQCFTTFGKLCGACGKRAYFR